MSDPILRDQVLQLKRVGLRPTQQLVEQLIARGEESVPLLLELATNTDLLKGNGEALLGPLHALRLLGELRSPVIVQPLLDMFPLNPDEFDFADSIFKAWIGEVPQMIARAGACIEDQLWSVAKDAAIPAERRDTAIGGLAFLVNIAPELSDRIVSELRAMLAEEASPQVVAGIVIALGMLTVEEAYQEVMAAFREKRVDTTIISPGIARQMLLTRARQPSSACVSHGFWERYDEHGPTEEDLKPEYWDY